MQRLTQLWDADSTASTCRGQQNEMSSHMLLYAILSHIKLSRTALYIRLYVFMYSYMKWATLEAGC